MTRKYFLIAFICFIFFSINNNLFAKKHPYRINAKVIESSENNDLVNVEIIFKNKNANAVKTFTVVIYVSAYAEDTEASGYYDYDYDRFEVSDDYMEYEEYSEINSKNENYRCVFPVKEDVGGNDEVLFVYPLDFSTESFSEDYVEFRYEIDLVFVSEIVYDNGEIWVYN